MSVGFYKHTRISLVVAVLDEEASIGPFVARIDQVFAAHPEIGLELVFVNDGSSDRTLEVLIDLQKHDRRIKIVDLSRNFGKEAAMTAGIDIASGAAVVPIDVDLQDPPELIPDMIAMWQSGFEVVLARRNSRPGDSWTQRTLAGLFYKSHNLIADVKLPDDVGDFRLMDRAVVDALKQLPESRRFMKGLFAWAGFRTTSIGYERPARAAGKSSFNRWKLWNFALEGITSFSTSLLRVWTYIGLIVASCSFLYAGYIALLVLVRGVEVPGYASLAVMIMFIGGLQLVGTGILGEYLGRTYLESKRRPVYLIRKVHSAQLSSREEREPLPAHETAEAPR
ncbi:glycosyltransferase family 2 protein [Qipengyuania sp. MTN3-11]|uniref:glycosyltransferase family 2 protein n=1 Tax=Qipengyuania sp. MTN3-11 TaxID=3056557 RepID=UPI0036F1BFDD